jgi:2-keto-4-pentenoate hydratase/2-oxohepta-3-ene-1,7-dioic acid hydratase in catechol pathway
LIRLVPTTDHQKIVAKSGYDSSDKNEQPSHPVIFTKRVRQMFSVFRLAARSPDFGLPQWTSIVPHGALIYPHPKVTDTLDYEGELGVIVGKSGFGISEKDALDYVWSVLSLFGQLKASRLTAIQQGIHHHQ